MTSPMTSAGEYGETVRIAFVSATPSTSRRWDRSPENRICSSRNHPDSWTGPSTSYDYKDANIVELGISCGGSTALIAQTAEPKKLVALELSDEPVKQLERFLEETNRRATIHPYYGVDQADRATVTRILDDEFGTEPLDLVTDDASHLLDLTRTSFEMLFPAAHTSSRTGTGSTSEPMPSPKRWRRRTRPIGRRSTPSSRRASPIARRPSTPRSRPGTRRRPRTPRRPSSRCPNAHSRSSRWNSSSPGRGRATS